MRRTDSIIREAWINGILPVPSLSEKEYFAYRKRKEQRDAEAPEMRAYLTNTPEGRELAVRMRKYLGVE